MCGREEYSGMHAAVNTYVHAERTNGFCCDKNPCCNTQIADFRCCDTDTLFAARAKSLAATFRSTLKHNNTMKHNNTRASKYTGIIVYFESGR